MLFGLAAAVVLFIGACAINAIGCTMYAARAAGPKAPALKPRTLLDGALCRPEGCTAAVLVQGAVTDDTVVALRARAQAAGKDPLWVCLNSPGGDHSLALMDPLPANVHTCVADIAARPGQPARAAICASACAWIWMAGRQRVIFGENKVGFHRPYVYDSASCAPGNWAKAVEGFASGWLHDLDAPGFEGTRSARHQLRWAGMGMGVTEAHYVDAGQAVQMGLQPREGGPAAFVLVDANSQQSAQ